MQLCTAINNVTKMKKLLRMQITATLLMLLLGITNCNAQAQLSFKGVDLNQSPKDVAYILQKQKGFTFNQQTTNGIYLKGDFCGCKCIVYIKAYRDNPKGVEKLVCYMEDYSDEVMNGMVEHLTKRYGATNAEDFYCRYGRIEPSYSVIMTAVDHFLLLSFYTHQIEY